ncbi:MAG: aminotransferase class III-fold pyridoxal phosphate-dependent enzyme [Candidatus Nanopelagicales bacterium]
MGAPQRQPAAATDTRRQARDHLLLNFTDMGEYADAGSKIIVRGEGCEVIDDRGRRFIDGISGLFCSNLGHSYGAEIGEAAAEQLAILPFTPTWYLAHPSAARLGARLASHAAPLGMQRVFFTNSGGEAVESAWKLVRQWHAVNGQPQRTKAIARQLAYHGTSMGALSFTGLPECRAPFEPMAVPTTFLSNTNAYRHPAGQDPVALTHALLVEAEDAIILAGPDQVAMLIAEPVQNSGGAFVPPPGYWAGLRSLCDRYGIILVADETITAFGRVGEWFASSLFDGRPDIITFAKGVTAGHAPLGGVLMTERMAEPFVTGGETYMHGLTYSGHPLTTAIADRVLEIYDRDNVLGNVRELAPRFEAGLEELRRIPLVGDVRGMGFFWALELVKDRETKQLFDADEADWLLRKELSRHMDELGLLCRLDDRGEPVIQLSPPLVSDAALLDRILNIVGTATERAWRAWNGDPSAAPLPMGSFALRSANPHVGAA